MLNYLGQIYRFEFIQLTWIWSSTLQEAMKIMGLPNWLHWTAWFIKTFMFVMISVVIIVVLMKVPWYPGTNLTVFSYSDPSLLLVYFIVYMIASICFCFMISVLFSKGNLLHIFLNFWAYLRHIFLIIMVNICQVKCSKIPLFCHSGTGQVSE
jgi:ATP-binding cassette subfamily A (ABC1) protein 3